MASALQRERPAGPVSPDLVWGYRYPFTQAQRDNINHDYRRKSTIQIEYEDEDPRIRALFEEERAKYIERKRNGRVTA